MKKVLILFLTLAGFLMAEVNWQPNYNAARAEAKRTGRPMLVLLVSHTCRWCRKLKNRTLQNPEIVTYINNHFVPLIVYRENLDFPDFIKSPMVPTTFFLTSNEKMLMKPVAGYWEPDDYMSDLRMAIRRLKTRQVQH